MFRIEVDSLANMISLHFSGIFDAKQGEELGGLNVIISLF